MPGKCSATDVSGPLNGSPTPRPCLWHDKTMEVSRLSRFGMTCEPLMADRGQALLTSWLAGFRARTSALPEKAQALKGPGQECGPTWRGSLARFDRNSSSWKTVQLCLLGDSELSSVTWPRSGMTAGGLCWELPMLERRTRETGFGFLLPTPCSSDPQLERRAKHGEHFQTSSGTVRRMNADGTSSNLGLAASAMFWPTPTTQDNPQIRGVGKAANHQKRGTTLGGAVRMFPTPQASDNRNRGTSNTPAIARRINAGKQVMLSMVMDGTLNPTWVEWLMGWPIGHTGLKPLATGKSRNAPQQPSECSSSHSTEFAA